MTHRSVPLLVAALLGLSTAATADPRRQAELSRAGQEAEAACRPEQAVTRYREAVAFHPTSRLARQARARLAWLLERCEGGYRPLRALMLARQRVRLGVTLDEIAAFDREARPFPPGLVRREALALVADTYLGSLDRPGDALAAYLRWRSEPNIGEGERQLAEAGAALARARLGRSNEALVALADARLGHRAEGVYLRARGIGRVGSRLAVVVLIVFVLSLSAGAIASPRSTRTPRTQPGGKSRWVLAALVMLPPPLLAWLYNPLEAVRFVSVAIACGAVVAVTNLAATHIDVPSRRRRALAAMSALAVVAAAFVATEQSGLLLELMLGGPRSR